MTTDKTFKTIKATFDEAKHPRNKGKFAPKFSVKRTDDVMTHVAAHVGGKEVAHADYWMETPTQANVTYMGVNKEMRGQGVGAQLSDYLMSHLKQRGIQSVSAELSSQGIHKLLTSKWGKPDYIGDNINEYKTPAERKEAIGTLPKMAQEDKDGIISNANHNFIDARWKVKR